MQDITNFIVIDDSKEDCYLIKKRLQTVNGSFKVQSFFSPHEAFDYVLNTVTTTKSIIILDIYMPLMDGFEFVEAFENLPKNIQDNYLICALTSSINKQYIDRISAYQSVKFFLEKPLKTESLLGLMAS